MNRHAAKEIKLIPVVNYRIKASMEPNSPSMKIGALGERTGVHVETIRYYQNLGLMPKPQRARGSVRR